MFAARKKKKKQVFLFHLPVSEIYSRK